MLYLHLTCEMYTTAILYDRHSHYWGVRTKLLENENSVIIVFSGFAKAFDSINHRFYAQNCLLL